MLIVRRRVGERIVITGGIEITVTASTSHGVRLAVKAPRGISVLRGEVHDAVVAANTAAAGTDGTDGIDRVETANAIDRAADEETCDAP